MLHIDIETYSPVDLNEEGVYKYCEHPLFEVLLIAYKDEYNAVKIIDLANGEEIPDSFIELFNNRYKAAHNATFERICLNAIGLESSPADWLCTAVAASYFGWPRSLEAAASAMGLEQQKDKAGKDLIRYFCIPCKPTKANGFRSRNLPKHAPDRWDSFRAYCIQDVETEADIFNTLAKDAGWRGFKEDFRTNYPLDQLINDRGIPLDHDFISKAIALDEVNTDLATTACRRITGLDNPNSPAQLKKWLSEAMGQDITSLSKETVVEMLEDASGDIKKVLELRQELSKSSTAKYGKMAACACGDGRVRGTLLYYGARTGRWAGRLIQPQNMAQNHLSHIEGVRTAVKKYDYETLSALFDSIPDTLSQLIRTAIAAPEGYIFAPADFSAIEARVTAWVAGETWRLDVFKTHGKIYEASAAMMFCVPIEEVTKGSEYRKKGKVAELALGYEGALGALKQMGGEKMGLSDSEMRRIVRLWRAANLNIVSLWEDIEACAHKAVALGQKVVSRHKGLAFRFENGALSIQLPSGRRLYYQGARLGTNRFNEPGLIYKGINSVTKKWEELETYGGKLVENIVQGIARDLMANALLNLDGNGYPVVFHVHDEAVPEIPNDENAEANLEKICDLMAEAPEWAAGLPLTADGYLTTFYKKD